MRLYLDTDSKKHIGYTPDWLKVTYNELEYTFDIQGEIDYEKDGLHCRVKGDLIPWTTYDLDIGSDEDIYMCDIIPPEMIAEIIKNGYDYRVGLYPSDDSKEGIDAAENDSVDDGHGIFIYGYDYYVEFTFETELNIY
jgi:hypothetical protein